MAEESARFVPIDTLAGVQPISEKTPISTKHYTMTRRFRFRNGQGEKVGGCKRVAFNNGEQINGVGRTLFSDVINGLYHTVVGTHSNLYSLIGSDVQNISPLLTAGVPAPNSLSTHFDSLNNVITTEVGSHFVTIDRIGIGGVLRNGDTVNVVTASNVGGIPNTDLTGLFIVRNLLADSFQIYAATEATSSDTGGGAVTVASGIVTINAPAHDNVNGDRVKIADATSVGGILDAQINREFIVRNASPSSFSFSTVGMATSNATGGGGPDIEYFNEIPEGLINETATTGYGAGLYGMGLYGMGRSSTQSRSYPRIWFIDRYADTIIATAGNQGPVYQWQGSAQFAPSQIPNAPATVNYAFISDNILVTFGAGGVENKVFSSDQNDIEQWTASSVNQVFEDDIEGCGRLTSHVPAEDVNLIFSEFRTYTMRYIGLPFVWEILPISNEIGIIAPMARVSVRGIAFWMGQDNFYMYRGGRIEIIPANSQPECTALKYVFDDLNFGQKSKTFAWYNKEFNEIWWHYPSANSNEPNRIIRVCLTDFVWSIDEWDRTAGEYPTITQKNPRLLNVNQMFRHEDGTDDDDLPMYWMARTNKRYLVKQNSVKLAVIPDNIYDDNIGLKIRNFKYPQSKKAIFDTDYIVGQDEDENLERLSVQLRGRVWDYTFSGESLGQYYKIGQWFEEVQGGADQS